MKIAVTSTGPDLDDQVEARFGRGQYFLIVDTESMQFETIENPNTVTGGGAGIQSAQMMAEKDVKFVLTGNCGPNAFRVFGEAGIQVIVGVSGSVQSAVEQFKAGKFSSADSPNVQSHFGVGSGQQPGQTPPSGAMGGQGMGMGRGRGMGGGRGMGMAPGAGMGSSSGNFGAAQSSAPQGSRQELDQLKHQAEMLKQQKQEIDKRISEMESGRKAAAFVQEDKCTGCGICVDICPVNAINLNNKAVVNTGLCTACAACVPECPNGAIIITQQKGDTNK